MTNPTTVAMIPDPDGGVDQRVSVYIPENAMKESPIIFCVMNGGWIQDAYSVRPQIEDGAAYISDSDTDRFGAAFSRGFVIVMGSVRSRGMCVKETLNKSAEEGKQGEIRTISP